MSAEVIWLTWRWKRIILKGRMFDDTTTTKTLGLPLWLYYYKQQKGDK